MRKRVSGMLSALIAAVAASALIATPAAAAPAVNGVFDLTGAPGQITAGPDGNVWTTVVGSTAGNSLARISPSGTVTEFAPAKVSNPVGITAGPDGNLWLTQPAAVVRVPPADPNSAEDFTVAALADPRGITTGPDGNLWAASGDKLLKIPPADPANPEDFTILGMGARGIDAGGGRLWIADFGSARIISATTAGVATPVDVGGGPQEVAGGPGGQIAYGNPGAFPQNVGRLVPGGMPLLTNTPLADPFGIDFAADGAYWIAQFAAGNLGRLTPAGAYTTLAGLPAGSGPRYLTAGPGNTVWVGLETGQQVARISGVEPPPGPPPPPPPDPDDTTAPTLQISGKRKQFSTKQLRVKASSDEAATVRIKQDGKKATVKSGSAAIAARRKLPVKSVKRDVEPGKRKLFELRFKGKRTRKKVRKLLSRGKKITFRLAGTATDAAGNVGEDDFKLTVRKRGSRSS